ncbi:MAG: hypothetical protein RBS58_00025 [Syntrophales bacterium]|jgi:hypothetical protein|nr:hypothetical protein [Syntrophales bacterium]MDX9921034.1 hypothetical protein [Syntrophales bacterium]
MMSRNFDISFDWLPRESDNPLVRYTLADIHMSLGDFCITELSDVFAKTVRKGPRVSAYAMAIWFASNWWRLRWEPERSRDISWLMSHKLAAAGGGYCWPDLSFSSDGEAMTIQNETTPAEGGGPVRYLQRVNLDMPVAEFESAVDAFIDAVINRVASKAPSEAELKGLWDEVLQERHDPSLAVWRKLEALIGSDPDEAPEELVASLLDMKRDYGAGAIEEMAVACREKAGEEVAWLWSEARRLAFPVRMAGAAELRELIHAAVPPSPVSWRRAGEAARQARMFWSMKKGPVANKILAEILSLRTGKLEYVKAKSAPVNAGFRTRDSVEEIGVFISKMSMTGRRFSLARIIGDNLMAAPGERLLPVCETKTQRQKFQRAFAQEFLCPFKDLMEYLGDDAPSDTAIENAAEHFKVSPLLVRTTLVNNSLLDRDCLAS